MSGLDDKIEESKYSQGTLDELFAEEKSAFWGRDCVDCGVKQGQPHNVGCDIARCLKCGGQCLSCECDGGDEERDGDIWDGIWPGVVSCYEQKAVRNDKGKLTLDLNNVSQKTVLAERLKVRQLWDIAHSGGDETTERQDFINYVWSFYGPGEIYGYFFNHKLTYEEVAAAAKKRMEDSQKMYGGFDGDSEDREAARDMMLADSPLGAEDLTFECRGCAKITSRVGGSPFEECPECAMERIVARAPYDECKLP